MRKLKSIKVLGFRGQKKPISISFDEQATFIVGRNGTGKTTLINLINAALTVDLAGLRDVRFDEIDLRFKQAGTRKLDVARIRKSRSEDGGWDIDYSISVQGQVSEFSIASSRRRPLSRQVPPIIVVREIRRVLSEVYKTTWLSIHRGMDRSEVEEPEFSEEEVVSDVDRKLEQVGTELIKFFSRLDSLVAEQTQVFQKRWFLSFLASDRPPDISLIRKINMEEERASLTAIFEKFNVSRESYAADLARHFELAAEATDVVKEQRGTFQNFFVIYDVMRLHSLVEQWEELQMVQKNIYSPKAEFLEIASDMLFRKKVTITRSNQIAVIPSGPSGDNVQKAEPIPLRKLSSGEKQLLIFLSETLLQEQEPYIFLADEPELSLHIEWQEDLVPSILRINPNAQIVFATHSPDVVNKYQSNIVMMEELID